MKNRTWFYVIIGVVITTLGVIFYHPIFVILIIGVAMISFGMFFSYKRHEENGWVYLNDTGGIYTGANTYAKPECDCPGCGMGTGCCI
ncbi:MAG: hypothetical protein ACJAUH_000032 [Saprospiraceae bacterium]|jgi:hypothetical protein